MCYLCGSDKARKSIDAALRVWKRKKCGRECRCGVRGKTSCEVGFWGNAHDWTKPPARVESWTAEDFAAYQKRTRYQSRATAVSFAKPGGTQLHFWGDTHDWSK